MREQLDAVLQAIQYIEEHLGEEIRVADIASAVGYSLYHFVRVFNRLVHHTPYDYLMRRRLSESALALVHSERKIIDLAIDYGFNSPEVYTRAFKRMFNVQPSEYRKRAMIEERFLLAKRTAEHITHINHEGFDRPVRLEQDKIKLAGLMVRIHNEQEDRNHLWNDLENEIRILGLPQEDANYFGLTIYPSWRESPGCFYMAAVATKSVEEIPFPLLTLFLPAGQYTCFKQPGAWETLPLTRDYIYQTWLPKSGGLLAAHLEVERYGQEAPISSKDQPDLTVSILMDCP